MRRFALLLAASAMLVPACLGREAGCPVLSAEEVEQQIGVPVVAVRGLQEGQEGPVVCEFHTEDPSVRVFVWRQLSQSLSSLTVKRLVSVVHTPETEEKAL